jgi:hypothetical protein
MDAEVGFTTRTQLMQMHIGLKLAPITDVFGPKLVAVKHGKFTEFSFPITTADGLLGRGLST